MKITSAQFVKSAVWPPQYPPAMMPEIAFVGRSNVGKSSLINTLVGRKNLAKTSNTPGRTQLINFSQLTKKYLSLIYLAMALPKFPSRWRKIGAIWLKHICARGRVFALSFSFWISAWSQRRWFIITRLVGSLPHSLFIYPDEERQIIQQSGDCP